MKLLGALNLINPTCGILKNVDKFENIGHSDLVISLFLTPVPMHLCVRYKVSMINHISRRDKNRKDEKCLPLKEYVTSKRRKWFFILGHSPKELSAMEIQVIFSSVLSSCGGRCHSFNMEELPVWSCVVCT